MSDRGELVLTATAIGVLAGMRSMVAPAVVSSRIGPRPLHQVFKVMAAWEIAADKSKLIPDRIEPVSLAGRMLSGGACAAVIAHTAGHFVAGAALVGAAAAAGSTYLFYTVRKALTAEGRVPDPVVAVTEDALALALGNQIVSRDFTRRRHWLRRR